MGSIIFVVPYIAHVIPFPNPVKVYNIYVQTSWEQDGSYRVLILNDDHTGTTTACDANC